LSDGAVLYFGLCMLGVNIARDDIARDDIKEKPLSRL
jgi:hypothetical protein